jgi:hypothetical protein
MYIIYVNVQPYIKMELWLLHEYRVFEFLCLFIYIYSKLARNVPLMFYAFVSLTRLMVKVAIEDLYMGYRLR